MNKRKIILFLVLLVPVFITAMLIRATLLKQAEEKAAVNFVETFHKLHPEHKHDVITKISDSIIQTMLPPPAPAAVVYYVNFTTGNDLNNGTSTATPWKTLTKVNGFTFASGDVIKLARGEKWYGSITVPRSDLTFDAYGSGPLPVISGFSNITSWTPTGGGKYYTSLTAADSTFNVFTISDSLQYMARYPDIDATDKGYLPYNTVAGIYDSSRIRSTIAGNWIGKRCVLKPKMWRLENTSVVDDRNDTLYLKNFEYYPGYGSTGGLESGSDGNGYFFVDDTSFLSKRGEFKYQKNVNRLYAYFGSDDPNKYECKASTIKILFNIGQRTNTTVKNIRFEGANATAIIGTTVSGINIDSVEINNCTQGISFYRLSNSNIRHFDIANCLQNGVYIRSVTSPYTNVNVEYFNVRNIGLFPGMGSKNQSGDYAGLYVDVYLNSNIRYGRVNECGVDCIKWSGSNVDISYNELSGACNILQDHGLIYCYRVVSADGQFFNGNIHHNILYNSYGAPEGVATNTLYANGVYLDGFNQGINVFKNIFVGNIARNNVVCNIRNDVNIYDNIGMLDKPGSKGFSLSNIIGQPIGLNVKRNVWFITSDDAQCFFYYTVTLGTGEDLLDNITGAITSYDSNWVNRADKNGIYSIEYYTPGFHKDLHTLVEWQDYSGYETHTNMIPTDNPDSVYLAYNNTFATKNISIPGGIWQNVKTGINYTTSVSFESFEGALFRYIGEVAPPAPTNLKIKGIKAINSNQL